MNKALVLVLCAEFWMVLGQICFKKSANRLNIEKTAINRALSPIYYLRYPVIWMGGVSMLVGLLFWFAALSSGELSFVYLLGSIQYIFALIAAHFFLHEKITPSKLIGTLLITLGIILTAVS